jgi:hypothetical protein
VIGFDGLGQEVHRTFPHRRHGVLDAPVRRHYNNRQIRVELLCGTQDAEPVTNWKLEISEDRDWASPTKLMNGLWLIARLEHGMAVRLEGVPEHGSKGVFVFDDEDRE